MHKESISRAFCEYKNVLLLQNSSWLYIVKRTYIVHVQVIKDTIFVTLSGWVGTKKLHQEDEKTFVNDKRRSLLRQKQGVKWNIQMYKRSTHANCILALSPQNQIEARLLPVNQWHVHVFRMALHSHDSNPTHVLN